jgi:flagellar assembly protein FliH
MLARLFKVEAETPACAPFVLPTECELSAVEGWHEPAPELGREPQVQEPTPQLAASLEEQINAAHAEAAEVVATARARAAQLVADAEADAARITREAAERGLSEARAVAGEELDLAVEDLRERLAHTLGELSALRQTLAAEVERELVQLALEIARKVVQREVAVDRDIPLTLARVALARVGRTSAKVRLHPDDFEYVSARRDRLRAEGMIELVADAGVGRGGCVVESERGDVDARIEEQFANVERGFLQAS